MEGQETPTAAAAPAEGRRLIEVGWVLSGRFDEPDRRVAYVDEET